MNAQACRMILKGFQGEKFDVLAYAERVAEMGITEDMELLQKLLDETLERVDAGDSPPQDPFTWSEPETPPRKKLVTRPPMPIPASAENEEIAATEGGTESTPPQGGFQAPEVPQTSESPEITPPQKSASPTHPPVAPPPEKVDGTPAESDTGEVATKPAPAVVPADGLEARLPEFSKLPSYNENQQRAAVIGLLKYCQQNGASDLHLTAQARPFMRNERANHYLEETIIDAETSRVLNTCLLTPSQKQFFEREKDYDFALALSTGERFRVNLMVHKGGIAGTYRMVPSRIQSLEELGFENGETIRNLLSYHNGLILVTGPVGSGKTTTLAALVHEMNENREDHIITVEEPIEFVQVSNNCSVTQRGVGPHTQSFRSALKGALRQDPDIIVIGEMRDLETIEMAISASETGHLVIGTMHTSDAGTTLNRLLDVFPPAQQAQIRAMVAESLRGIICQRLLPGKEGGLVLACELLLKNTAVSSLIREGKTQGLSNIMETGKADGMIQMDASILNLWRAGKIAPEVARESISNEMLKAQIQ